MTKPVADEEHHLAGLDHLGGLGQLGVLDVAGGAQHEEVRSSPNCSSLGRCSALTASSTASSCRPNASAMPRHLAALRLVQAEPDEARPPARGPRPAPRRRSSSPGWRIAVDVERAVDDRCRGRPACRLGGGRRGRPASRMRVIARTGSRPGAGARDRRSTARARPPSRHASLRARRRRAERYACTERVTRAKEGAGWTGRVGGWGATGPPGAHGGGVTAYAVDRIAGRPIARIVGRRPPGAAPDGRVDAYCRESDSQISCGRPRWPPRAGGRPRRSGRP